MSLTEEIKTELGLAFQAAHGMRKVALIYNPASGQHSSRRDGFVDAALSIFRNAGIEAEAVATTAPGSAAAQVRECVRRGCDAIIACGGDGTVHEVLQSLVGSDTALGVVPLGTANALAADLGLPLSPAKAARDLLSSTRERVPVGRVWFRDNHGVEQSRYFTVAGGVGADAHLLSRLDAKLKRRFGYALYAVEGIRCLIGHSFPSFEAVIVDGEGSVPRVEVVTQILAIRIHDFGGLLRYLVPGATLRNPNLRLVAFKTRNRFDYLRFLVAVVFRRHTFTRRIELIDAISVECRAREGSATPVSVEADGEFLGRVPARIEIVQDAVTILVPSQDRS